MTDLKKHYLGDGAYVQIGSYYGEVALTTEDGVSVQNRVVLGPGEMKRLQEWVTERAAEWARRCEDEEKAGDDS